MVSSQNENENEKKRKSTFQAVPLTESHDRPILKREDEPKKEKKGSRMVSSWNENEKRKKKYLLGRITNGIP